MIGRVLYVALLAAAFAISPASAATSSARGTASKVSYNDGVVTWQRLEHRSLQPEIITRFSPALAPGRSKLVARGRRGLVDVRMEYSQRDGGPVRRHKLWSIMVRKSTPRVVMQGMSPGTLAAFEARGLIQMASLARSALLMLATAYTADCAGCGGMTAIGRRAGFGIVAVDPRVIPLGTRLFIPGYGLAIAGDTGGDIVGNRIDLGFDSLRGAILFGRRDITVYRLK